MKGLVSGQEVGLFAPSWTDALPRPLSLSSITSPTTSSCPGLRAGLPPGFFVGSALPGSALLIDIASRPEFLWEEAQSKRNTWNDCPHGGARRDSTHSPALPSAQHGSEKVRDSWEAVI